VIQIHLLTEELRTRLKTPLGILLRGTVEKTLKEFKQIMRAKKPSMIISVGDALSRELTKNNIFPKVIVIDYKIMREPATPFATEGYETMKLRNNQGTISDDAWTVIASAIKHKNRVKVVVEGEEDLLTLVSILEAPEKALIVYGQPYEGMVVVEVTSQKKNEINRIVDSMERVVSKS
jgi:uncharacterized protein (UPF0218 family)